ncbi:MAG: type II toxin-antitoxin system VapC family toxin [Alphaproteobacteria bacterium]|nr:type II toxin-antitoxin system VapC family toxin [Alphaproteobacteria bacterium]
MRSAVLDASVVVRWFTADSLSDAALGCRTRFVGVAPDLLPIEVANALRLYCRTEKLDPSAVAAAVNGLAGQLTIVPSQPLLTTAFGLAVQLDHSVYDCLYAALALHEAIPLVTADRRFMKKLAALASVDVIDLKSVG